MVSHKTTVVILSSTYSDSYTFRHSSNYVLTTIRRAVASENINDIILVSKKFSYVFTIFFRFFFRIKYDRTGTPLKIELVAPSWKKSNHQAKRICKVYNVSDMAEIFIVGNSEIFIEKSPFALSIRRRQSAMLSKTNALNNIESFICPILKIYFRTLFSMPVKHLPSCISKPKERSSIIVH